MAEVAQHKSQSDCWSVVDGSVYNLTSWIAEHPGGSGAILSMCGVDGTNAFQDQHSGERRPANELAGFKIGVLAK
jgi:cytochrome b involved in lipid metabolism